jgi:hypothetical protein
MRNPTEVMLTMRVLQISELIPNYTDSYEALNISNKSIPFSIFER